MGGNYTLSRYPINRIEASTPARRLIRFYKLSRRRNKYQNWFPSRTIQSYGHDQHLPNSVITSPITANYTCKLLHSLGSTLDAQLTFHEYP